MPLDVVCRGEAKEDKDEKTTSLEQSSEFDKELSLEAKKLLNGHRPIHEWQRLKVIFPIMQFTRVIVI